jgi:hypothetical protein
MDKPKVIDRINDAIMQREYGEVHAIYIDLSLMKDLKLGLMLAISDESQRKYLIENIDTYNKRVDRKFTTCFKDFPYKEEVLEGMYTSEEFSDFIIDFAPDTDLSVGFYDFLRQISQRNYRAQYNEPVDVIINTYPLHNTELVKRFKSLFLMVNKEVGKFKFSFIRENPFNLSAEYWSRFDFMLVDDIALMCSEGTPWRGPMEATSWLGKTIYSPPNISEDTYKAWDDHKIKRDNDELTKLILDTTEQTLRMCCRFQFVSFMIPIGKPNEVK